MKRLAQLRSFFSALVARRRLERQLNDELSFHVEARTRDLVAQGETAGAAAMRARAELGDPARWRTEAREARGLRWLDELSGDLRIATRMLRRSPGFTATALLTLAIGIGAATSIFGELNAVLWKTLPVLHPEELRTLLWTSPQTGFLNTPAFPGPRLPDGGSTFASYPYPVYAAMRDGASDSFSDLACWMEPGELLPVVMAGHGFGAVQFVSGNYFRTLGVQAALGRALMTDDDVEGASPAVAVITHRFWQRAFGGDPNVLATNLTLNGTPFAIVGVLPKGFFGLDPSMTPDVMVPMAMLHIASAGGQGVLQTQANWSICRVIGRLRAGVSDESGRAQAEAAAIHSMTSTPNWPPRGRVYQLPKLWIASAGQGLGDLRAATIEPVLIVSIAVGVTLLVACANIAGLLLARGAARQKEMATRLAIGAPRWRLARQLLTESLVVAMSGGILGVAVTYALARIAPSLVSQFMAPVNGAARDIGVAVTPDTTVLAFSVLVTALTGLAFGLLPALRSTHMNPIVGIKQTTAPGVGGQHALIGGKALVAVQTALSIVLLVGAAMFIRTVANLRNADLGYHPDGLLYVRVEPRSGGMRTGSDGLSPADSQRRRAGFFEEVVQRLGRTPEVISASASVDPPLSDYGGAGDSDAMVNACTRDFHPQDVSLGAYSPGNLIAPGFFETMQLPLLAGRDFTWAERSLGRQRVVIVNQSFVKKFFAAGTNAVGETVGLGRDCPANPGFATIVGVVADSRMEPRRDAGPMVYQMFGSPARPVTVILRTAGEPRAALPAIRQSMTQFNASVPLFGETTAIDLLDHRIRQERVLMGLLVVFATFALLLCCLGIFGLLSYLVGGRTSEIGVRLAVGAQRRDVMALVVGESLRPVLVGLAGGVAAALVFSRYIESMLFDVSRADPASMAGAAALFVGVAALAAALPARRASQLEPVTALRCE